MNRLSVGAVDSRFALRVNGLAFDARRRHEHQKLINYESKSFLKILDKDNKYESNDIL